jgi:hypothetical protein
MGWQGIFPARCCKKFVVVSRGINGVVKQLLMGGSKATGFHSTKRFDAGPRFACDGASMVAHSSRYVAPICVVAPFPEQSAPVDEAPFDHVV